MISHSLFSTVVLFYSMSCDALVTGALYLYTSFIFNVTCCLHIRVCIFHTSYMLHHCLQAVKSSQTICDLHILILIPSQCAVSFYICIHFILFIYIVLYSHVLTFALFMSLTSILFFSFLIHLWDFFFYTYCMSIVRGGARTRIPLPTTASVRLSC